MRISNPSKRLNSGSFYRLVDQEHNQYLARRLRGTSVLDIGCGYGSLVDYLCRQGKNAVGIDSEPECIDIARRRFPGRGYILGSFEQFPDRSFDHVVMKDALHHVFEERDVKVTLREIKRILKPGGTLVIFDPNIQFVLRLCRKIMRHNDAECDIEDARKRLQRAGFTIRQVDFYELFALPASGGYVGICFVPPIAFLQHALILLNRFFSRILVRTPLARHLLWRYLLVAVIR